MTTQNKEFDITETKQYKAVKKKLSDSAANNMITKSMPDLKEFIAATSGYIQQERSKMEASDKYVASKETLKECTNQFKDDTSESDTLLKLAVLVYSKKI